ncbi:MAG TPA: TetR/AcrR family transcriptional regulator [Bryobacteraceae bacterium]|nr:TetR/AcrR family transcriptional regulator [Bryobacteraceae bacterium]
MQEKLTSTSRQRLSSPQRRAAILNAALHLFAEKGFRGTTTRELAARVGVSEPVLYEHFRAKSDLYTAIIDEKSRRAREMTGDLTELEGRTDTRGFFEHLGLAIIRSMESDPLFTRLLLFSALEGHELKDLFYERHSSAFMASVTGYIERRIAEGSMRAVDPMIAARAFFGMIAHFCISSMIFNCARCDTPREQVVKTMVDIFLSGVCTKPEVQQ